MKCAFYHFRDPNDHEDQSYGCCKEAAFTCCDYGGPVCEKHKCRCSKPLEQSPVIDAAKERWRSRVYKKTLWDHLLDDEPL